MNNAELVIDDVTGFARDFQYRRQYALDRFNISARKATPAERLEPFERYQRGVMKWLSRKKPFAKRRYLEQEGLDFDRRLLDFKIKGTIYLDGYWQSEDYFKDVERVIRRDLRILPPKDEAIRRMAERILDCNAVVMHARFFDKPGGSSSLQNLERNYYIQAIREISKRVDSPHFFLFSDNPVKARQKMGFSEDKVTCVEHNRGEKNAYTDLWLMTQCKHFIIANSTFSWWGAWLTEFESKIVIAPKKCFNDSSIDTNDLIPDGWLRL